MALDRLTIDSLRNFWRIQAMAEAEDREWVAAHPRGFFIVTHEQAAILGLQPGEYETPQFIPIEDEA